MKSNSPATKLDPAALADALAYGDVDLADHVLANIPKPWTENTLRLAAELHLRKQRWSESAECYGRIERRDLGIEMRQRMAMNLASLEVHRPEIYRTLVSSPGNLRYTVEFTPTGEAYTVFRTPEGRSIGLTPNNNPAANLANLVHQLKDSHARGDCYALCGMGDGRLVQWLAQNRPKLFLDMEHPIFVIEPECQVVLNCLMMLDLTGPNGPIEQKRFTWIVGEEWREQLPQIWANNIYTPHAAITIGQSLQHKEIAEALGEVSAGLVRADVEMRAAIDEYYKQLSVEELAEVFSTDRPRRPRVLVITTRFSTVLQYSARDAVEAFGQIGCETHFIIEPSPAHRLPEIVFRKAIHDFKPDLVFQIDHLRAEYPNLFPANLPFACWIQDHLPNLTNANAGKNVKEFDFVLTGMSNYFANTYGYPREQLINLPQIARVPIRPTQWTSTGDDLAYVSNWSKTTDQALAELKAHWGNEPHAIRLIDFTVEGMNAIYAKAGSLSTPTEILDLLAEGKQSLGIRIPSAELEQLLARTIFDRYNNTLYRHQALGWAVDIAREMGLKISLYGRGWENHPRFKEFARGPVKPGADLEKLSRDTRLNLQLEPYACFTHARLLTGLFAGGFFLVRDHPFNQIAQNIVRFLDNNGCAEAQNRLEARQMLATILIPEFDALLKASRLMDEGGDCIEMARDWQKSKLISANDEPLPRMNDILFDSAAGLRAKIVRFLDDEDSRFQIVEDQRLSLESRLSYASGLRRMMREISERLGRLADGNL